ncbi:hypothetical protein HY989_04365 [Candidatus Micrarchaeota archaeon]|nr:hypothetical protein [Candidatus Micrarchaeota archaeon]
MVKQEELPENYHKVMDDLYEEKKRDPRKGADLELTADALNLGKYERRILRARANFVESQIAVVDKSPEELEFNRRLLFESSVLSLLLKLGKKSNSPIPLGRKALELKYLSGPKFTKSVDSLLARRQKESELNYLKSKKRNGETANLLQISHEEIIPTEEKIGHFSVGELVEIAKKLHAEKPAAIRRLPSKHAKIILSLIDSNALPQLDEMAREHKLPKSVLKLRIDALLKKFYGFNTKMKNQPEK